MQPAFSVIFLTVLIGAGQGLFLALFACELGGFGAATAERLILAQGGGLAVFLSALGLLASFFHLGRPERAWRAATMWRTSWLSREVIVLPLFMAVCAGWALGHAWGASGTRILGVAAVIVCLGLFACTAMIYASLKFLQEWASPLTVVNYLAIGCASGTTLAAAFASFVAPVLVPALTVSAWVLTLVALASRVASLLRNARLKPRSSVQSAIGVRHPVVRQRAQGFMGGSYATREFFHGRSAALLRSIKWFFLVAGFLLPAALLVGFEPSRGVLLLAVVVQFTGLIAERWFFFAQANHPQNLYYQTIS
ncbi:MAG: dimethyl sulfoxide reductase anchor subunit [Betaproteobacteria bacterium]|nr:dimethyl sulfoxide reductase anchor subunit [Betaproteobacteria bacterium]